MAFLWFSLRGHLFSPNIGPLHHSASSLPAFLLWDKIVESSVEGNFAKRSAQVLTSASYECQEFENKALPDISKVVYKMVPGCVSVCTLKPTTGSLISTVQEGVMQTARREKHQQVPKTGPCVL